MKKHYKLTIKGRVQGVWYRASTKQKAIELGLMGFVQNEHDGSVYAEIEGEAAAVRDMIAWCKQGPELAQVERVEVEEGRILNFESFEIRR